jgi:hypothetical protein
MPMVVASAVFLVLLGYSNEQMTPVIGLLGTMIGYILGSSTSRSSSGNTSTEGNQAPLPGPKPTVPNPPGEPGR